MAKEAISEEVQVLKFFETGPIDKVGVVFNIVCEKMRVRLRAEKPEVAPIQRSRRPRIGNTPSAAAAELTSTE